MFYSVWWMGICLDFVCILFVVIFIFIGVFLIIDVGKVKFLVSYLFSLFNKFGIKFCEDKIVN